MINGAYTYDSPLMEKAARFLPDLNIQPLDQVELTQGFEEITGSQQEQVEPFLDIANEVLAVRQCRADIRQYNPANVPVFFLANDAASFLKSIEQSQEITSELFGSILDDISKPAASDAFACVCFNYRNPQVQELIRVTDRAVLERCIRLLYIQALFLARQPLSKVEMEWLNEGIGEVIQWGIQV